MKQVCILMYHQVGDFPSMKSHRATYCHYRNFKKQMAFLSRMRYPVLTISEALAGLRGEKDLPERAVVLTFDDGYDNFYEYAAPELSRRGFPSVVFLLSEKIGRNADWLAKDGLDPAPLMGRKRIEELTGAGVEFASHGRTHRRLSRLAPEEIREEIVRSKAELEDLLQAPVRHFCYPYGDYNAVALEAVREAGYDSALTCIRGRATPSDDHAELPRMAISFGTGLGGFAWKLHFQKR
jgi:peptidoglycan/xylan/chitin deacetylase (PgdA/CDA1 family)